MKQVVLCMPWLCWIFVSAWPQKPFRNIARSASFIWLHIWMMYCTFTTKVYQTSQHPTSVCTSSTTHCTTAQLHLNLTVLLVNILKYTSTFVFIFMFAPCLICIYFQLVKKHKWTTIPKQLNIIHKWWIIIWMSEIHLNNEQKFSFYITNKAAKIV